jgi:hypothetical protein
LLLRLASSFFELSELHEEALLPIHKKIRLKRAIEEDIGEAVEAALRPFRILHRVEVTPAVLKGDVEYSSQMDREADLLQGLSQRLVQPFFADTCSDSVCCGSGSRRGLSVSNLF